MSELENITILFHDTYEEVSKKYGYQTREDTKVFDMESPNGKTMYETVEKIMTPYLQELERLNNIIKEAIEYIKSNPNVFYDEYLLDVETIKNSETTDKYVGEIKFISNLLNILQGKSDE